MGIGLTDAEPGSVRGLQLVVEDIQAAHDELAGRGVEVSEVDVQPWGSFVYFSDPDGNTWSVQQIPSWSVGIDPWRTGAPLLASSCAG